MNNIEKTIDFVTNLFHNSDYLKDKEQEKRYRLEHTFRVANIAKRVAKEEGLSVEAAIIGGLLHDISYIEEMKTNEDRKNHGRRSAELARTFVNSLDMPNHLKEELLYGVAIHVDDNADFEGNRTVLAELIGEADNIDRFDRYRLYEGLLYAKLNELSYLDQIALLEERISRLKNLQENYIFKSATSQKMWSANLSMQIDLYQQLVRQLQTTDSALLLERLS